MVNSSKRILNGTFNDESKTKTTNNSSNKRVLSGTISQETSENIKKSNAIKAIIDYEKTNRGNFYDYRKAEEANNIDVDALDKEIKDLESKRDAAKPIYDSYKVKSAGARGDQIEKVNNTRDSEIKNVTGNYTYDELNNLITEKKAQLVIADRNKRLKNLSSVINPESENYDKEFDKYKQIGQNIPWKEAGEMKGNVGSGLVTKTPYSDTAAAAWVMHSKNNPEAQKDFFDDLSNARKYEYLEPQEFDLLAYYLGKDKETGGKQAEEYLDLMEETLNQRMGKAIYDEKLKGNTALEILYGVPVGLDQFANGVKNLLDTESNYIPASAVQNAGQLARSDLSDVGFIGGLSMGQIGYDILSTTANMAPSILVSTAVGMINPTAGAWAGGALMGASSAGNAYQEALNNGMEKSQARVYSTLVGASEAAMSATVSKVFGGKVLSGKIENAISGIDKGLIRFAANYGWAFASEGLEEAAQEILTPLFENIALGYNKNGFDDIDWSEVAYSFLLGGLSGGVFDIIGSATKRITDISQIKKDYNTPQKVQNLLGLALSMPTDSKANTLAKKYNTEAAKQGKLSANKIYNLAIASENFINDRLVSLGDKTNTSAVANAIVRKLVGNELSVSEIELLSKSSYGQEVLNTTISSEQNNVIAEPEISAENQPLQIEEQAQEITTPEGQGEEITEQIGFREPTDQDIYREPTVEEENEAIFGKRKTVKQRHILDVAKTLDKNLKVVFVPKNSNVLNNKNGKYVFDTNTMYLAEDLAAVEAYSEVFKHEFTHRLELKKAYDSFKTYLFNKSDAFGKYAQTRMAYEDKRQGRSAVERTREEAINDLVNMYLDNFKGDRTISQSVRDNFTKEKAEREAVADFVARTLFKGNTADLRFALTEDLEKLVNTETDLELFEEMARDDRNLLQKIIDAIRDFINDIKIIPQFKDLEQDLRYIEQRLTRVYNSADNKKAATKSGEVYRNVNKVSEELSEEGLVFDAESESVFSADSWESSEYVKDKKGTAKKLSEAIGISERKALQYIKDIDSIANKILSNYARLGYVPSPDRSAFVSNSEYGGSIDMSTLCAKRRWLTGTFSAIQKALNHTALTANEILEIRNMLKEKGIEVSCGLCYVEGSRAQMGKFAKEFIERYKKRNPDWVPDMADVNTPEGVEEMRIEHPEAYEAYEKFWNNKGVLNEGEKVLFASQQKPKLYQLRTDYKHEILDKFSSEGNVVEKNKNGGLRIQSFSDFEIVHLIDMMQVIIDMSRVGLYGQAYTKVPEFALALGDTGLKINLLLIAKDVDTDGNLVFDDVEGMPFETAMNIRNMYSKNVGTVLVVFNDAQLMAALKDSRIDFVLPFHRSQWKKAMYDQLGLPSKTKDYTYQQNEKYIKPVYYTTRNGTIGKRKAKNYMPNEYWDFSKSGTENAKDYLKKCAKENKRPKFYKLLVDNGDGSYSLQPDGSTDGYWKLLVDFKMYDNKGQGSEQEAVKPNFNMEECNKMLDEYEGGHEKFPVNQEVVDTFVGDYMKKHGEQKFKESVKTEAKTPSTKYDLNLNESYSSDNLDTVYLKAVKNGDMETAQRLVDEAAKEAGYTVKAYHGTSSGGFTVFDTYGGNFGLFGKGAYFTKDRSVADSYQNKGKGNQKQTYSVFLNPQKTLDMDENAEIDLWVKAVPEAKKYFENCITNEDCFKALKEYCMDEEMIRWEAEELITDAISYNMGYNAITHIGGGRFNKKDETRHRVYIIFEPEQIKSADPVTYDDNGNVIPLSERFNENEVDIRYSSDDISSLQRDLYNRHKNGELTNEEYIAETDKLWEKANETYGTLPQGEKAKVVANVPAAVSEDEYTKRFTRTIIETDTLKADALKGMEERILLGDFSYKVASDENAIKVANKAIKNGTAESIWEDTVNDGKRISKNQIAIGEQLLADAIKENNTFEILKRSSELSDIFTRAGQIVQAARLLKKMTGAGRLVSLQRTVKTLNKNLREKYGEGYPPIKISEEAAQRLSSAKTVNGIEQAYQEILQEVANQVPATFMDKWNAWRYFAMLSNPKTHIRNLIGNGIFVPAVRIKDAIAFGVESAFIKDESKKTKSLIIQKEYRDFAKKDSSREDVKQLLKGNKYNDKTAIREKQKIFKTEVLNFLTEFNSNALEAEDMLFKNKHYIHALAGFLQARGVDLNSVSNDVLDEARIYAVKEARKATFNDVSEFANAIQRFANKNLAANLLVEGVLPFKRTPINIVKRGIEYSPIGLMKTLSKGVYDVKKGKIKPTEFIDGLASGLTGTGIMLVGMLLANLGLISGGEKDDDESQFEKLLGKQEYAVEFFGKSYTVDWAAPACIPFFVGVEILNTINEGEAFELSQIGNAVWNSLEPITNLSMLSGIQGVIESARYADSAQTLSAIAVDSLTSYAMQGVPSLSGAISRTIDPTQRSWYIDKNDKLLDSTAQTIKNNIQSKIPGLSYKQIPKIDMWGREVSRGGVGERVLENFISPGYYSEIEYNEAYEELKRIFKETEVDVFPNIAAKYFKVNNETKHLTANEYVTYAKAKGEYSFDYLQDFIQDAAYKKLDDKERADVIENLYEYANAKAKTTVSDYDLMKSYKTVTNWERNGRSAVDYYIYQAIKKQ